MMTTPRLYRNMVLRCLDGPHKGRVERILCIDATGTDAVAIDVYNRKTQVYAVGCRTIESSLFHGSLVEIQNPYKDSLLPDECYSRARIRERDANLKALGVLLSARPEQRFDP